MPTRRDALQQGSTVAFLMMATGLFPLHAQTNNKVAFSTKSMSEAFRALGKGLPVESKGVSLTGPEIAEDGAMVMVGFGTSLPNIKRLALLVEKNPFPLVSVFNAGPDIELNFSMRIKMEQSSDVYAVAIANDGTSYFAKKEIKVTLGGCG